MMIPLTVASPEMLTIAQMNPIVINLLVGLFLLISIVMILIVLIQRPQGGGLGGAFGASGGGGGGAGQTAFGTKTGDVLTGATIGIFVLFLVVAVVLNFTTRPPTASATSPTLTDPNGSQVEDEGAQDQGSGESLSSELVTDEPAAEEPAADEGAETTTETTPDQPAQAPGTVED